jgi:hypothetical protein
MLSSHLILGLPSEEESKVKGKEDDEREARMGAHRRNWRTKRAGAKPLEST